MHGQPLAHQNRGPGEVEITNDMDNQFYNRTIRLCDEGMKLCMLILVQLRSGETSSNIVCFLIMQ